MHMLIRDPETGGYIELCVPTYGVAALVIRVHDANDDLWREAGIVARAAGAKMMVLIDNASLPGYAELSSGHLDYADVPVRMWRL